MYRSGLYESIHDGYEASGVAGIWPDSGGHWSLKVKLGEEDGE